MGHDRRPDQALLCATADGEADAFGVLFVRHSEPVLRYLRRHLGSPEDAADLLAETFAAALLATHRGHARAVPDARVWLLGIAQKKLVDSYRAARVRREARLETGLSGLPLHDEDLTRIDELAGAGRPALAALEQLSAREREAVVERILNERDYDEIACDLGEAPGTIRQRVSRGLTHLRRVLAEADVT